MTEPDYKIQELFDTDRMCRYYIVWKLSRNLVEYYKVRQFDGLEEAKRCVRELRKYKQPIYHYIED